MKPWKPTRTKEEQAEHRNQLNRSKAARRRLRSTGMPAGLDTPAPQRWRKVIAAYRNVRDLLTKEHMGYLGRALGSNQHGWLTFTKNSPAHPVPEVMFDHHLVGFRPGDKSMPGKFKVTDIGKLVAIIHLQKAGT